MVWKGAVLLASAAAALCATAANAANVLPLFENTAIVRTIDGRAWQRVRFPEPLDFTAVVAGDARTATVTATDGRQFATTDGGTTWTRR